MSEPAVVSPTCAVCDFSNFPWYARSERRFFERLVDATGASDVCKTCMDGVVLPAARRDGHTVTVVVGLPVGRLAEIRAELGW